MDNNIELWIFFIRIFRTFSKFLMEFHIGDFRFWISFSAPTKTYSSINWWSPLGIYWIAGIFIVLTYTETLAFFISYSLNSVFLGSIQVRYGWQELSNYFNSITVFLRSVYDSMWWSSIDLSPIKASTHTPLFNYFSINWIYPFSYCN